MSKKAIGILLLVSFALLSASAVCLASTNMGMIDDCGNSGHDAGAMACPFMSSSIPALTTGILFVTLVVTLVIGFKLVDGQESERERAKRRQLSLSDSPGSLYDPVLGLISRGILHSRVYA